MLVLTRKKGERVVIGDDIVVTIIDVKGDSVRIGFDAPRGLPVQRAEIIDAVKAANVEAASASATAGEQLRDLLGAAPTRAAEAEVPPRRDPAGEPADSAVPVSVPETAAAPAPARSRAATPTPGPPIGRPSPAPRAPTRRPGIDGA